MGDAERKALPAAPRDGQVEVRGYGAIRDSPFPNDDGLYELRADQGGAEEDTWCAYRKAGEHETVTGPGLGSYEAWRKVSEPDHDWDEDDPRAEVETPSYDDMDRAREQMEEDGMSLEEFWYEGVEDVDCTAPVGIGVPEPGER